MNYDEAIKELYVLYTDVVIPEDEAKFNHYKKLNITELFDKFRFVKSILETAKKEHELLGLFRHILGVEADLGYYNGIKDTMIEYSVEKPIQHILDKINELNTIYRERINKIQELTTELERELK